MSTDLTTGGTEEHGVDPNTPYLFAWITLL
jgi:hypothetical protein